GKEVSIHQNPINYYGWSGHGYIIIDPETGAGAYKVSGGANGGVLVDLRSILVALLAFIVGLFSETKGAIIDAISTLLYVIDALLNCKEPIGHFLSYFALVFYGVSIAAVIIGAMLGFFLIGAIIGFLIGLVFTAWLSA